MGSASAAMWMDRQLKKLSPDEQDAVLSFREFLRAEGCYCGRDGTVEIDDDGLVMCSGCVLANVPPIPYALTALALPGHDDSEASGG